MSVNNKAMAMALALLVPIVGCSIWDPFLAERAPADHGSVAEEELPDLGPDCAASPGNLIANPSFETPATGTSGDGTADNTGEPASTIPGPWTGCCSQVDGGTTWSVSRTAALCGERSLEVMSADADGSSLLQLLAAQSASSGKSFELSGAVHLVQAGTGGSILLEATDGTGRIRLAATDALRSPTASWVQLSQTGSVPSTGRIQVRITSTGNLHAYVDDLTLRIR
jgi:hypothetical protein